MSAEATVCWAHLDRLGAERFESLLSPDERERAAAFMFPLQRGRFVAARGFLRTVLAERLGTDPAGIEFSYGEHGKPWLAGGGEALRFNSSHSAGVAAVALCEGREVGIDVEAVRDDLATDGIARRYLPARDAERIEQCGGAERSREFFRAWVRQEAYAKARGAGLELIGETADLRRWSLVDLSPPNGFAAALAVEGTTEPTVSAMPL